MLGKFLNNRISPKKHKNVKNMALNRPWKGHLCAVWEMKQEGRISPSSTSAGSMQVEQLKIFASLCISANNHKNDASVDLGVANKL